MAIIDGNNPKEFYSEVHLHTDRPDDVIEEIRTQLLQSKVVKIVPHWFLAEPRKFYDQLADSLGTTLNIAEDYSKGGAQTGERWMEIRYDEAIPDMEAYRHSKNGQPLHTDESYISDPADVMVFYCVNRAPLGGETNFVDGNKLVEFIERTNPPLLTQLASQEVTYKKAGSSRKRKIIDLSDPAQPNLNFNYYCIDPDAPDADKQLNQDFFDFLELHVRGSYIEENVCLNPMEGVLWWDHFVLHGRTPFAAKKTNDRLIWKTGFKWRG